MEEDSSELPAYSPSLGASTSPRERVTHRYSLENNNGNEWLSLEVSSKALSSHKLPLILEGEAVTGSVCLDLESETRTKSVEVYILGELIVDAGVRYTFVKQSSTLWQAQSILADASSSPEGRNGVWSRITKLQGTHRWPFSLTLPSTVEFLKDGTPATYRLPATFLARWARATINYRIVAKVEYRLFNPRHIVGTNAVYVPRTRPGSPSVARQLAYQENSPLIGPDGDPDGWHTLGATIVDGTLFNTRNAQVRYTVSLAQPLSYTRGSVIPIHLTLESDDMQALDLLSDSRAHSISLRRSLSAQYDTGESNHISTASELARMNPDLRETHATSFDTESYHVQSATCWALPIYDKTAADKRELQGEIHIAPSTNPTSHLRNFKLWYTVIVYAPKTAGFVPVVTGALCSVPVEICTAYADGPRPIVYSPPKYDEAVRDPKEERTRAR